MKQIFIAFAACIMSLIGTRFLVFYLPRLGMTDIPNERSLHEKPVPRGGGLAIILAFLLACALLTATGAMPLLWFQVLSIGTICLAVVGWADDKKSLKARWRVLAHALAAIWVLWYLGESAKIELGFGAQWKGVTVLGFCFFYIIWLINLYNFMDGSDGIAAVEGITVALASSLITYLNGGWELSSIYLILAAAISGFLFFNWSPAKIFMGDVGSGVLGFLLAGLSLIGEFTGKLAGFTSLILLARFITDATFTSVVRFLKGHQVYQAHRNHTYQHAIQRGVIHSTVALYTGGINIFWLTPLAWLSNQHPQYGLLFLSLAYTPLLALCVKFKAGRKI